MRNSAVGMHVRIRCALGKTEQQIVHATQRAALAGLVGTEHDVKAARRAAREVQLQPGERAKAP